jgi:hypothetical protein
LQQHPTRTTDKSSAVFTGQIPSANPNLATKTDVILKSAASALRDRT